MQNNNKDIFSGNEEEGEKSPAWLVTYADLFTLLFAFFVVIAGSTGSDQKRYDEVRKSISKALKGSNENEFIAKINKEEKDRKIIVEKLKESLMSSGVGKDVDITKFPKGVLLKFPQEILFKTGSATLNKGIKKPLIKIGTILNQKEYKKYPIAIKGYSDSIPISTSKFPSNWELSAARAASVMNFFIKSGLSDRPKVVVGYADTKPLVKVKLSMSKKEKDMARKRNRRIEIFISYKKVEEW